MENKPSSSKTDPRPLSAASRAVSASATSSSSFDSPGRVSLRSASQSHRTSPDVRHQQQRQKFDSAKPFTKVHMFFMAFFINLPWVISETAMAMILVLTCFSCLSYIYDQSIDLLDIGLMPCVFLTTSISLHQIASKDVCGLSYPPLLA
eukprot:gene1189-404_t